MGKFNILTSMVLNSGGYTKGVNAAKKSTKEMKTALDTAGKEIGGVMGKVGEAVQSVAGDVGKIGSAALSGVQSFGKMIPAIKGVSGALIATGIGAIVVAIGVAFAALNSYLKGTQGGADRLNKFMSYLKGGFEAVIKRVQVFGEGIALVFEGKFREGGKLMKEAFAGGILDEITSKAKENLGIAERENKLWRDRLAFGYEEADLQTKIAELKLISVDTEGYSAQERKRAVEEAIEIEKRLGEQRNALAKEEYEIIKQRNSLGNTSRDDAEKEQQAYRDMVNTIAQTNDSQRTLLRTYQRINREVSMLNQGSEGTEEVIGRTVEDVLRMNDAFKETSMQVKSLSGLVKEIPAPDLQMKDVTIFPKSLWEEVDVMMGEAIDKSATLAENVFGLFSNLSTSLSDVLSQGANSFGEYVTNLKKGAKEVIGAFISQGVAAMVMGALKDWSTKIPFGYVIAPAMAGLAAGLAKTAFNSLIPTFASGGIVSGPTMGLMGEYPGVQNNPEVIAPLSKLTQLLGGTGGNTVFRIERDVLVGVQNSYKKELIYF